MKIKFPETYYHDHCIEFLNGFVDIDKDGCQRIEIVSKEPVFHCVQLGGTESEVWDFMTQKVFPLAQMIEKDFILGGFILIKDNVDKKIYFSNGTQFEI